ncbi:MAG TPA: hypothetical protein VM186_10195, partial [Planctomycetota bacterium]|nr:hypothetical protein [Planctomycetota bacterium]
MRFPKAFMVSVLICLAACAVIPCRANAEDLLKAARDAHASRHLELAAKYYQQVIDQGNGSAYLAKLGLASAWAQMGRYDDAIDLYLATEKGDYHWSGAGSLPMAEAARNAGLQEKLVPAYEAICTRDNYRDAFGWLQRLYLDTGNFAKANDIAAKWQWPITPL